MKMCYLAHIAAANSFAMSQTRLLRTLVVRFVKTAKKNFGTQ